MKDLLALILTNITLHPDDVQIDEHQEGDVTVFTLHVHPDDMGRVIGKSGKVIKAIRNLSHVVAIRQEAHYRINLAESAEDTVVGDTSQPAPASTTTPTLSQDLQPGEEVSIRSNADQVETPAVEEDIIADALDVEEE